MNPCRECLGKYVKGWYKKHPEKRIEQRKTNKLNCRKLRTNPEYVEKEQERQREWYHQGGKVKKKEYQGSHREEMRGYAKKSYYKLQIKGGDSYEKATARRRRSWDNIINDKERHEKYKAYCRKKSKELVEALDDKYIVHIIKQDIGCTDIEIPQELIELKKAKITLSRTLKGAKNAEKSETFATKGDNLRAG